MKIVKESEKMDRQVWEEKIEEAYTEAFGYDSSISMVIRTDGTITGPKRQGEGYYCRSHGMHEECPHCIPVYSVHGWSATSISHIYDTEKTEDGEVEKPGFVFDREAQIWIENIVDNFSDYISSWAEEEVEQLLLNVSEAER